MIAQMSRQQNLEWWGWAILIVALLACALWLYVQIETQRDHERRKYGQCEWLGCNRFALAGDFGGKSYCPSHKEYLAYGLEEPLI